MKQLLIVGALLVGGCSKKESAPASGRGSGSAVATTKSDEGTAPAPAATPPATPGKDLGTCKASITGAVTVEETTPGGLSAVTVSHWYDAKTKEMMHTDGAEAFSVNCNGQKLSLSFLYKGSKEEFPLAPKKLEIATGKGKVGFIGSTAGGSVSLMSGDGSFEITALDATHIAGTFALEAKSVTDTGNGTVKITGTFDFKKP